MKFKFGLFSFLCCTFTKAFVLEEAIHQAYVGIINRNEEYPKPFLIHRPFSETPRDAVSEGVGYGLLLALYLDDQSTFDRLLEGADQMMWNGVCYDWRVNEQGQKTGIGAATDAEQDIAFALLKADEQSGWNPNPFYRERGLTILHQLWERGIENGILRPGYYWGGFSLVNPGYFSPAWYKEFARWDPSHDWLSVVDRSYEIIAKSPGYEKGLLPDWMDANGRPATNLGYNAYGDGNYMFKDAIRVFWRLGMDAIWNQDERAIAFLKKAYQFQPDIKKANFYQMNGELLPENDEWIFGGGKKTRSRREHSPLTVSMWAIPIWLFGTEGERQGVIDEFAFFFPECSQTYWGRITNPRDPNETIDHNEMYFDQFLAEFGSMVVADQW